MYEGNENFSVEFLVSRVKHRKIWPKRKIAAELFHLKRERFSWERKSRCCQLSKFKSISILKLNNHRMFDVSSVEVDELCVGL